jgi:hypothetical protein
MSTRNGQITGTATYDAELFEPQTIERIVTNFIAALAVPQAACASTRRTR